MSEKNSRLKNLIFAHGWLGVIMSVLLFLVFWAGAISLFRAEIQQWAELPNYPIDLKAEDKALFNIIEDKLAQYPLNTQEHLVVVLPDAHSLYYKMSIDLLPHNNEKKDIKKNKTALNVKLKIHPKTGDTIGKPGQFHLANFLYALHYKLNLSNFGTYLIGFVTLFFLVALFSGVYIHAKKIIPNFFSYRTHKKRTQLLDMHNVIGVISLPFTLMYAISGLVFNLLIIYQLSFLVLLYQGDQDALINDAGYTTFSPVQQTGIAQDMTAVIPLLKQTESNFGPAKILRFYNYGDENAVLEIRGRTPGKLAQYYDVFYQVNDGTVIQQSGIEQSNAFRKGREVLTTLHFGDFALLDLRLLYFLLAIAVTAMIVVGNILWINKRNNQKDVSVRATQFISNMTIGACGGLIVATAAAFLAERVMPAALESRADYLVTIFIAVSTIATLAAYWDSNKKRFIGALLCLTAITLLTTIACDWWIFGNNLQALWLGGSKVVFGVETGLLLFSIGCVWVAKHLLVLEE